MGTVARWIRLGPSGPQSLRAACIGFCGSQLARAAPIVLWTLASEPFVGDFLRAGEGDHVFALLAPLRLAPGRRSRWPDWGLAPALATYRRFGVRAYLDQGSLFLNGRSIGASGVQAIGSCAVVAGSFLPRLPVADGAWLERDLEAAFRERIEAQHGWQFENSWPSRTERMAIADAFAEETADAK